jgi:hypothetical protein
MVDYSYLDLEDILEEEEEEYISRRPGEGPGKLTYCDELTLF